MSDPSLFSRDSQRPRYERSFQASIMQLGITVFFVSLSVLFAGSLLAYVLTRLANPVWRAGVAGLPLGLIGSTLLLAGLSAAMHWALAAARQNRRETLKKALWLALAFAIAFLLGQAMNWRSMAHAQLAAQHETLYPFTFYLLTGLHALHVVGGFVPHGIVISRAARSEYSSSRLDGLKFCVQYWDFLGVVWLVLLTTLFVFT
jgi:cytochrome c oxidase subunit III